MQWLNLRNSIRSTPEFISATKEQRGVWISLILYCTEQENSGVITQCAEWTDAMWLPTCGITAAEIENDCALWYWDGQNLFVWAYPVDAEARASRHADGVSLGGRQTSEAKARAARQNGARGGRPKKPTKNPRETHEKPTENPRKTHGNPPSENGESITPSENNDLQKPGDKLTQLKPNLKKGKGKETPPTPQGGNGQGDKKEDPWKKILPEKIPRTKTDQKLIKVLANTPTMTRINEWFGHKPERLWNVATALTLKTLKLTVKELDALEAYYTADIKPDDDFRRHDIATMLNNARETELDRAVGLERSLTKKKPAQHEVAPIWGGSQRHD